MINIIDFNDKSHVLKLIFQLILQEILYNQHSNNIIVIKNFIHITLAFSVFLSSAGLLVNNHYCQDSYLKSSFFLSFGSCCEMVKDNHCSSEKMTCSADNHEEDEKDCCKNKKKFFKFDQDQLIQKPEKKSFEFKIVLNAINSIFQRNLPTLDKNLIKYFSYSPPLIIFDHQVRLQTFLC